MDGPARAGVNRTNWNLRSIRRRSRTPNNRRPSLRDSLWSARAIRRPGEYTIKIKAADKEASQKVTIEEDTRIVISVADRTARREMIDQLYPMAKSTDKDRKTIGRHTNSR